MTAFVEKNPELVRTLAATTTAVLGVATAVVTYNTAAKAASLKRIVARTGLSITGGVLPARTQTALPAVLSGETGYASGTDNAERGWKLVGEEGPELMFFHGGETVLNNRETREWFSRPVPPPAVLDADGGTANDRGFPTNTLLPVPTTPEIPRPGLVLFRVSDVQGLSLPDFPALSVSDAPGLSLPDIPAMTVNAPSVGLPDTPALNIDAPAMSLPDFPALTVDEPRFGLPDVPTLAVSDVPELHLSGIPALTVADIPELRLTDFPAVTVPGTSAPAGSEGQEMGGTIRFLLDNIGLPAPGSPEFSSSADSGGIVVNLTANIQIEGNADTETVEQMRRMPEEWVWQIRDALERDERSRDRMRFSR